MIVLARADLLVPIKGVEATGRFEVASRLQQRTNAIMRYAVQSGLIDYNPAQEMAGAVFPVTVFIVLHLS